MKKKKRRKNRLGYLFLGLIILLLARLYVDHRLIKITKYEVESIKIPSSFDGFKIAQISDLHNEKMQGSILSKLKEISPDIVIMTGDMVSANSIDFKPFLNLAKDIASKYKTFYIKGNHEGMLKDGDYKVIEDALETYKIEVLDNEKVEIKLGGESINLYGLWCNQRYYSRDDSETKYVLEEDSITRLLGAPNNNNYNVLLIHTPAFLEEYQKWGADLVLSGHEHGGLIRLPYLGGVFSPERILFPELCYGEYQKNNTKMIISSGLSRGTTGFRLFNRPEIVEITLKQK